MAISDYTYHRLVVGYHGCDRSTAERVLLDHQPLEPSDNDYDWLGKGIYFWEHGAQRAREFAEWKQKRGQIREPIVLGAYIHLGHCFDLTDTKATSLLGDYFEKLRHSTRKSGNPLPRNKKAGPKDFDLVLRKLDCAVLNFALNGLGKHGANIQTVRGVFVEGAPAYPGARIHTKTHVQVAVRDPTCILGYFLPAGPYT